MTTPPQHLDDIVTLGHLQPPTEPARVAHPQPGFIAPTATAGGDASPTTHTKPQPTADRMASTPPQQQPTPLTFTALNRTEAAALLAMTTVVLTLAVAALVAVAGDRIDLLSAVAGLAIVSVGHTAVARCWTTRRPEDDREKRVNP